MARVSREVIHKLNDLIESLTDEARSKCALCSETLTHIVKKAEAETGAGTATVTKVLSEKINKTTAPQDRVSGSKLRDRVRYNEGKVKMGNSPNKSLKMGNPQNKTECGTDEKTWASRARYARRSMALTRATAKASRLAFSWVMVLAGYEPTPSEEIPEEQGLPDTIPFGKDKGKKIGE